MASTVKCFECSLRLKTDCNTHCGAATIHFQTLLSFSEGNMTFQVSYCDESERRGVTDG